MNSLLERLAEKLAEDAVEQARIANDQSLIDAVAKSLADTSTTFKETFLTCVRYIQAEERARAVLPNLAPRPEGLQLPPPEDRKMADPERAAQPKAPEPEPQSTADDPADAEYAEVDYLDDEPSAPAPSYGALKKPAPAPSAADAETPASEPEITGPRKPGRY